MKKSIWISGLSLVLLLAWGVHAPSQEVTESGTATYYTMGKFIPLGRNTLFLSYEGIGLNINDTGTGLFHNSTLRALGSMTMEHGVYKDDRGAGVWNLQNGDKIFFRFTFAGETKPGETGFAKGAITFIDGTGHCAGIQGGAEVTRYVVRSATEGIGQNYHKAIIKYRLAFVDKPTE